MSLLCEKKTDWLLLFYVSICSLEDLDQGMQIQKIKFTFFSGWGTNALCDHVILI